MSRINRISVIHQADGSLDIVVPASMAEDFKLMVKKGTNLSPDMHVEIRDFSDRLFKRDHIMNGNMKWELPSEDAYYIASLDGSGADDMTEVSLKDNITPVLERAKPICMNHPETCNCPKHCK